jgi:hypothetical protein
MMHWSYSWNGFGPSFGFGSALVLIVLWSLVWKGMTLWVTARRGATGWFILFLLLNSAGILEIIYLLATKGFDELKKSDKK